MNHTIGSLFTGYGGIDLALKTLYPGAKTIINHRFPDAPNLGDITQINWTDQPKPTILTGGFPCFTAGTLVDTINGYRPIETLQKGDLVRTHQHRYMPVIQTMNRNANRTLDIKAMGAPTFTTTHEHPFYTRLKGRKWNNAQRKYDRTWTAPEWTEAKNLTKNHYLGFQLDTPDGTVAPIGKPLAYLIGRWLGDGWVRDSKRKSDITGKRGSRVNSRWWNVFICSSHDEAPELEQKIREAGFDPHKPQINGSTTRYRIGSKALVQLLAQFGRGAAGKRIPGWVYKLPTEDQHALWEGWVASDGHNQPLGQVAAATVSVELAHGMARVARNAFKRATSVHKFPMPKTTIIEGRTVNQKDLYQVCLPAANREAFIEDDWCWVPVRKIEDSGEATVYNIGVEEDESYTAWGLTVHNCQDVSSAGLRKGLKTGTRSGLWAYMAEAINALQPQLVIIENVAGLLSATSERTHHETDLQPCPLCVGDERETAMRALGTVLADLAEIGFDAQWGSYRASDVGAPHRRERVFIAAYPQGHRWGGDVGERQPATGQAPAVKLLRTPTTGDGVRAHGEYQGPREYLSIDKQLSRELLPTILGSDGNKLTAGGNGRRETTADALSNLLPTPMASHAKRTLGAHTPGNSETPGTALGKLLPTPNTMDSLPARTGEARERQLRRGQGPTASRRASMGNLREDIMELLPTPKAADGDFAYPRTSGRPPEKSTHLATRLKYTDFGQYAPAIEQWARITGHQPPNPWEPTKTGKPQLAPRFVEWMMGLPPGWVTDTGISRTAQIKALGNGVVPLQAAHAINDLLRRSNTITKEQP